MNSDLLKIKKCYGEQMMHLCRSLFPSILEKEGLLFNLLKDNFAYSKILYDDFLENSLVDDFRNYIYSLVEDEKKEVVTTKSPKELLSEVGYTLYECKSERDIQKFKKYYEENEQLCTFNGGRLNECYVFFAVKKNVNKIKRENFPNPKRQDEYGTSVISIQFSRGENNILSIKNRYNHTVNNPDATFSNNLDNIIEGLTDSFIKYYKLNINKNSCANFEMSNYVRANDNKLYKYNYEIDNIYYCPDNIIIDNFKVINDYQEKEKYLVMDYFIIDLENKKISLYDKGVKDSFPSRFVDIKLIEIIKNKENKHKKIGIVLENNDRIYIEVDSNNCMLYYQDDNVLEISNNYLRRSAYIQKVRLSSVIKIDDLFMYYNERLNDFYAPNLREIGNYFMNYNSSLCSLNLPSVVKIGKDFLGNNEHLQTFTAENLKEIADDFMAYNSSLRILKLPSVVRIGNFFLEHNQQLKVFTSENLEEIGCNFLLSNTDLKCLEFLKLRILPNNFLFWNEKLRKINVPNVVKIYGCTLSNNIKMRNKILSQVEKHTKIKRLK